MHGTHFGTSRKKLTKFSGLDTRGVFFVCDGFGFGSNWNLVASPDAVKVKGWLALHALASAHLSQKYILRNTF